MSSVLVAPRESTSLALLAATLHRNLGMTFEEFRKNTANDPVYVILGVQGSGTNLCRKLLTNIFGFSVFKDRSMVFNEAARLGTSPSESQLSQAISRVRDRLFPSALARKTRKDVVRDNEPFEGIESHLDTATIRNSADLARTIYAYRAYSAGTRRMAIKSDDLWESISAIDRVIPNRRIVLLTRDFRDNLLSVTGKNFGPIEPLIAANYVKERFTHYHREYLRSGENGLHVRFEDMVEAPKTFVANFSSKFSLEPTVDPDRVLADFPLNRSKVRKWQRMLNADALAGCEAILHDELETYGYELSSIGSHQPSSGSLMLARARDTFKRVPQKLHRTALRARR